MANQDKYTLKEYEEAGFIDYGKGVNLDLSTPKSNLATDTGIDVEVVDEKGGTLETNPVINKLYDPNHDSSKDLKVFSLQDTFNIDSSKDIGTYDGMLKQAGYTDASGLFNSKNVMLGIGGAFGGKLGYGKTLKGPTGKPVLSMGVISEKALNNHYDNFAKVQQAYSTGFDESKAGSELQGKINHRTTSTGFAMTLGNFHFSRDPSKGYFEGHKQHLSSDSFNAHMMLKSMEAMSKGLDPSGYRLDGKNEDNKGMAAAVPNGIGGVTEDGYFTSVANNGLGWSKAPLYGHSSLSVEIAKAKGVNVMDLVEAMEMARSNKDLTVTDALKQLGAKSDNVVFGESENNIFNDEYEDILANTNAIGNITNLSTTMPAGTMPAGFSEQDSFTTGVGYGEQPSESSYINPLGFNPIYQANRGRTSQQGRPFEAVGSVDDFKNRVKSQYSGGGRDLAAEEKAKQQARSIRDQDIADRQAQADARQAIREYDERYNTGGQVSSPVGQLAGMLRENRLGYQEGGEVNVQEMGFVNGQTPDQVTDAQSVADDVPMDARDGDYILNAPAVENIGVRNIVNMMKRALQAASAAGVEIVDYPSDIPESELVKIVASGSEFRIPGRLIPFLGKDSLDRYNNAGKKEVTKRVEKTEDELQASPATQQNLATSQQNVAQQVSLREGGEVFLDLDLDQGFI